MAKCLMINLVSLVLIFPVIQTNSVKLELGLYTHSGHWSDFYENFIPFSIEGRQFFFAQREDDRVVFIRELLPNGALGAETEKKTLDPLFIYRFQFIFSINGRHFIYGQSKDGSYLIQELLSGGKMGRDTGYGHWKRFYDITIPFSIDGRQFFYGQSPDKAWFIQELLPGGTMGDETSSGKWERYYKPQFGFTINGRSFIFGQSELPSSVFSKTENRWFIQEVLPGGRMGSETDSGNFNNYYPYQFPFTVNGSQYFYGGRVLGIDYMFVNSLLPGGKLGPEVYWGKPAARFFFGYSIDGKTFLYSYNSPHTRPNWFIREVLLVNGAASESKDTQVATSLGDSDWTSTVAPETGISSTDTP